jgi:hypothetical protein
MSVAMIAITTSSSTSVKPCRCREAAIWPHLQDRRRGRCAWKQPGQGARWKTSAITMVTMQNQRRGAPSAPGTAPNLLLFR